MKFSWSNFLINLAALAPTIVAGTAALASESDTVSKQQLATDSLNLATGLSHVLLSGDPEDQQLAAIASQLTASTIAATSQAHAAAGLPHLNVSQ